MNIKMKGLLRKINLFQGENQTNLTTILKLVPDKDIFSPYALQTKQLYDSFISMEIWYVMERIITNVATCIFQ